MNRIKQALAAPGTTVKLEEIKNGQLEALPLLRELTASQRVAQDARNELCQKCGRYREAHKGACDGCRWKE